MIQPLRSISITETSTLLRVGSPLCPASVLSPSWVLHFGFLPYHRNDRFPRSTQEPGSGSRHLYAGDAAQAVNRFPLDSSWSSVSPQFRRRRYLFSTPHQWFACARLPEPHLIPSCGTFSLTLTTSRLCGKQLEAVWNLFL